jgi:hypothetical protein
LKFKLGDETDRQHCIAMQHEFLRSHDAYVDFDTLGRILLQKGDDSWLAYRTYNAYSRFIHHLYEFLLGVLARERGDTAQIRAEIADPYVTAQLQRILNNKRQAIKDGTAPIWENSIDYYPEEVPKDFAREFREYRNKVSGHVTHTRSSLSLSDFYDRNHKFLNLLYREGYSWWGVQGRGFPDLDEITKFSLRVKERMDT